MHPYVPLAGVPKLQGLGPHDKSVVVLSVSVAFFLFLCFHL